MIDTIQKTLTCMQAIIEFPQLWHSHNLKPAVIEDLCSIQSTVNSLSPSYIMFSPSDPV